MPQTLIDDIELGYTDVGSGPPLVLIHGYPFDRTLWTEQINTLSDTHRVIAPDLRGFGESETANTEASMSGMARDVASLMDHLGVDRAVIGGLSMGGYVAFAFYRQYPERVKALVLADTRPQADTEEGKQTRREQSQKALAEGMAGIADSMLPKLLTPETVSKRPELVKRIRDMMLRTKPAGAAGALLAMATRDDQTPILKGISVPTLILVGRDDAITPLKDSERIHAEIPGSRLAILENAGHVSNLEQTERFNSELLSFLKEIGA